MTTKIDLTIHTLPVDGGTIVHIKFGPVQVANARLGGRWTAQQARQEWKKNPGRFKTTAGLDAAVLQAAKAAA